MDNSLTDLCDAIKKILAQLKPQSKPLSFIVVTGKSEQGKSTFLKQAHLNEIPLFADEHAKLYFNDQGILVELGESWLNSSKALLQNTLKQLNRCNRYLNITGLIFCIEAKDLLLSDLSQFAEQKKAHLKLLNRFGLSLAYPVELALVITKMDHLAGFTEFYQTEHASDLAKALGFSLIGLNQARQKMDPYTLQFNQFIDMVSQQVISKMHPARSTMKRSLIREFPLQLASLRVPIQALIQGLSPKLFHLHSIYFTSAEQGGLSVDQLNKKIQHEYALMVQDSFPQAPNFRAYFVEGALKSIQKQCNQAPLPNSLKQKYIFASMASIAGLCLLFLGYNYYKTTHLLDTASKELLAYDTLNAQGQNHAAALYHLSKAESTVKHIASNSISVPSLHQLKYNLHHNTENLLQKSFLPALTEELEQVINNPANTPITRYKALKIYLMLSQPKHRLKKDIYAWFKEQWAHNSGANQRLVLLEQILSKPLGPLTIKSQIVSDARNYLNALPTSYLYYSLAKELFPTQKQKISVEGFNLATDELPVYFTQTGFKKLIAQLPEISKQLQTENWVLAHQDLSELHNMLTQAYCFDYVTWWQSFIRKSLPLHYQDYQQGKVITQNVQQFNAINKLMNLMQQETKPDLHNNTSLFNKLIANKFTDLNLISQSSTQEFSTKIAELERFIATLSVVNDEGKTAFILTKNRFINENASDPISQLFAQARQLPEPLSAWAKQLAGDSWALLIKDSRQYINHEWQQRVYKEFQESIAKRYPFDASQKEEISISNFNHFFASHGTLNSFSEQYIKPFLDVSSAEWKPKVVNDFVLPISDEALDKIIRANIITNMFFSDHGEESKISFSLQKINLDPVIANLNLQIGDTQLIDTQETDSLINFTWPQTNAKLSLDSIEGNHYELAEQGIWALFKLLEKVNVLIDEQDSSSLQILFEVNSNSGRYLLKTNNQINPFTPGILNGFSLNEAIV